MGERDRGRAGPERPEAASRPRRPERAEEAPHLRASQRRRITELPPEYQDLRLERTVLVGLARGRGDGAGESLEELARLAETAGAAVAGRLLQRRERPDPATYLGKGKAQEVRDLAAAAGADTVIVDEELSPAQLRNLEELCAIKVIDRAALILDIFAQHAHSSEGKVQVELAQLEYLLPRLRGWGESLSRLGGGIGTRGPGESQLEVDRRRITRRIVKLREEIADLQRTRQEKRRQRTRRGIPSVALVGYTNAGKSTLLNRLTGADVPVEDRLFSTLDPTTRRLALPGGRACVLTDTVGFVSKLPHGLVEAFKSTLEEASRADLLLHVVDGSAADPDVQAAAVREVLGEIDAAELPELMAVNKVDLVDEVAGARLRRLFPDAVHISAASGEGIEEMLEGIAGALPRLEVEVSLLIPYDRGDVLAALHAAGAARAETYTEEGTLVRARLRQDQAGRLEEFIVDRDRSRARG